MLMLFLHPVLIIATCPRDKGLRDPVVDAQWKKKGIESSVSWLKWRFSRLYSLKSAFILLETSRPSSLKKNMLFPDLLWRNGHQEPWFCLLEEKIKEWMIYKLTSFHFFFIKHLWRKRYALKNISLQSGAKMDKSEMPKYRLSLPKLSKSG